MIWKTKSINTIPGILSAISHDAKKNYYDMSPDEMRTYNSKSMSMVTQVEPTSPPPSPAPSSQLVDIVGRLLELRLTQPGNCARYNWRWACALLHAEHNWLIAWWVLVHMCVDIGGEWSILVNIFVFWWWLVSIDGISVDALYAHTKSFDTLVCGARWSRSGGCT